MTSLIYYEIFLSDAVFVFLLLKKEDTALVISSYINTVNTFQINFATERDLLIFCRSISVIMAEYMSYFFNSK